MRKEEKTGIEHFAEELSREGVPLIEARKRIIELLNNGTLSFVNVVGLDYLGIVVSTDLRKRQLRQVSVTL